MKMYEKPEVDVRKLYAIEEILSLDITNYSGNHSDLDGYIETPDYPIGQG